MTIKSLQTLISAGFFSAALLSGAAYADDSSTKTTSATPSSQDQTLQSAPSRDASPAPAPTVSNNSASSLPKKTLSSKSSADHDCGGANGCGGADANSKK